jgi:L-2-hydroxyglutarate oxidase LhgO
LALANGVDELHWLSAAEVAQLEPELRCTKALFSPSTGIVDAKAFMLALQGEAETLGAGFAFNTSYTHARRQEGVFIIAATGANGEISELTCAALINCSGHGGHDVAMSVQAYQPERLPPRFLAKGNYCSVSGRSPFKHLIYPVPVSGALGIHATLDLAGAVRFGPDIQWIDTLDFSLPPGLPKKFSEAVRKYWPGVLDRELSPSYCGIRPKIHGPEHGFADFLIQDKAQHGIPGLINLFGIESPGLTSSLAIAKRVADCLTYESTSLA